MSQRPPDHGVRIARARLALEGLSVGDAFGEPLFRDPKHVDDLVAQRRLAARRPRHWTADTPMALSIVEDLDAHGAIDRDAPAAAYAARYRAEPWRGYGGTAHGILTDIGAGVPCQTAAGEAIGGEGSMGN